MRILLILIVIILTLQVESYSFSGYTLAERSAEIVYTTFKRVFPSIKIPVAKLSSFLKKAKPDELVKILVQLPKTERLSLGLEILASKGIITETQILKYRNTLTKLPYSDDIIIFIVKHDININTCISAILKQEQIVVGPLCYNVKILDKSGRQIIRHVDLRPTIDKMTAGVLKPNANEGWKIFNNFEKILPTKETGYYKEVRVITDGIDGAGPQRIVFGKNGEILYTPDHYKTFLKIEI